MSETSSKMLGITVLPEYFQVEGIETVLDNCQNIAGANAITTSPYVMRLAATGEGQREPPIDAGAGAVRILDRPLWGKRELHVGHVGDAQLGFHDAALEAADQQA